MARLPTRSGRGHKIFAVLFEREILAPPIGNS